MSKAARTDDEDASLLSRFDYVWYALGLSAMLVAVVVSRLQVGVLVVAGSLVALFVAIDVGQRRRRRRRAEATATLLALRAAHEQPPTQHKVE